MIKLLVVEDDAYVRSLYQRIFTYDNYTVEVAEDGEVGLAKVASFKPDLVLLDINMPKMNGLEVLRTLKADPVTKSLTVVMLTNLADDADIKAALTGGAAGYLLKSELNPDQVRTEVKNFLKSN